MEKFPEPVATPEQPKTPEYSQEQLTALVRDKLTPFLQESTNPDKADFLGWELQQMGPRSENISKDSFYTKLYRALCTNMKDPSLYQNRMAAWAMRAMDDQFLQNGHMIDPETLISEIADIQWRSEIPAELRYSSLSGLNYILSFYWDESYNQAIQKQLDFAHPANYALTANILELVDSLYTLGGDLSFSEDQVPEAMYHTLQQVVERGQGSYLLNLRAQELLEKMEDNDTWPEGDHRPFIITKDSYAWHKEDGLYTAPTEQKEHINSLIATLNQLESRLKPPQHMIDQAIAWGEKDILWTPDQRLMHARQQLIEDIADQLTHKVTIEDLTLSPVANKEQAKIDLYDFNYLMRGPVRRTVEAEFGELSALSLPEQFHLLRFLKSVSVADAEQVKAFTHTYGTDGLRTFLTNSYDPAMSRRVIAFAEQVGQDEAKKVFSAYASVLDSAGIVSGNLTSPMGSDPVLRVFPPQLFESFVRRAAHLFGATESASAEELKHAFEGVELLAGVLADASVQDKYMFTPDTTRTKGDNYLFKVESKDGSEHYDLKVFVRPRAEVAQRSAKRGNDALEQTLQARINIELSLDHLPLEHPLRKAFYNKTTFKRDNKTTESSVIRFGLDLDDAYDPPRLSFDMGRNARDSGTQTRTGDVLGNVLEQVGPEGHHLVESFDPELSKPENFARIAESFKQYLDSVSR